LTRCRLCDGPAQLQFRKRVLERYDVGYWRCQACGSLQTDEPTWLAEAYAIPGVHIDVGQAGRAIHTWLQICFLLETIGFAKTQPCVDFGASIGLFARLMRDAGYECFAFDLHDACRLANYFKVDRVEAVSPALITAFEVFEHLAHPAKQIGDLLDAARELVVFSTGLYDGQGEDWEYLVPVCGQHVFFASAKGLTDLAARHGFDFVQTGDPLVFVRKESRYRAPVIGCCGRSLDDGFVARQLAAIRWGPQSAMRDLDYALQRFTAELGERSANGAASGRPTGRASDGFVGRIAASLRRLRAQRTLPAAPRER
jgi:hypothetical protein